MPALVRGLIVRALKEALAREGTRASTTGGGATIAAFRPAATRRAAASVRLAALAGAAGGWRPLARRCRGAGLCRSRRRRRFDVGSPRPMHGAPARAGAPSMLDHPLGAARAQLHDTYIVAQTARRARHRRPACRA